jgi:MFS family permease
MSPTARHYPLAALSLPMLLSSLGTSVANVALPTLKEAFGGSFQATQWVVIAYLIGVTTMIVAAGRLGDTVGRRRLLLLGIALFTAASVACGAAPTLPWLIAARAIQGLGGAVMMALSIALVSESVLTAHAGRAMGVLGTMSAAGTALGPSVGGLAISALGWRALFLANVPLGALALFLAWRYLPGDRPAAANRSGFDYAGTVMLVLSVGAYALSMTIGRGSVILMVAFLVAAAVGALAFWRIERGAAEPLVPFAALRDAALRAGLATSAVVSTVMMATLLVGPFYLSGALGLSPAKVGLAMSVGPITTALFGVPAGRIVDRFGTATVASLGLAAIVLGTSLLAGLPTRYGVWGYAIPLVIATAGYAMFQTANNTGVMSLARGDQRGLIAGLLSLSRNLGLITGASAMGAVFAWGSRVGGMSSIAPAAVAMGMRITFLVAGVMVLAGMRIHSGMRRSYADVGKRGTPPFHVSDAGPHEMTPTGLPLSPQGRSRTTNPDPTLYLVTVGRSSESSVTPHT